MRSEDGRFPPTAEEDGNAAIYHGAGACTGLSAEMRGFFALTSRGCADDKVQFCRFQSSARQSPRAASYLRGLGGLPGKVGFAAGRLGSISPLGPAKAICPSLREDGRSGATVVVVDQVEPEPEVSCRGSGRVRGQDCGRQASSIAA
jgi:hypothetical protein